MRKEWKEEEIQYIKENYSRKLIKDIAKELDRTYESVSNKIYKLSILFSEEVIRRHSELVKDITRERSKAQIGEKNPNWKNGIAKDNMHYKKLQEIRYPERQLAKRLVSQAIRSGRLKRLPCAKCGELKVQGHHEDYSKPLEVIWFCKKHHDERHRELGKQNGIKSKH